MIHSNLTQEVFFAPACKHVNRLLILASYATPNMASWLVKNLQDRVQQPIDIDLLVGMVPYDGLSVPIHEGFVELHGKIFPPAVNNFTCSYLCENPPVHANIYIWLKDEQPLLAFAGSADFVQSAFISHRQEIMLPCDPIEAINYYRNAESKSIYCNHAEVEDQIILQPSHQILDNENKPLTDLSGVGIESVTLSLLTNRRDIGLKSGLNWGQRTNRNKNEAYIPLPVQVARSGFFPLQKRHFTVVTDDGHNLILRVEQQNNKAITTPLSNAQLGEYFRNRLNLSNGDFVKKSDLVNYGRTNVTFYKIDEEQYFMDFHT